MWTPNQMKLVDTVGEIDINWTVGPVEVLIK